MSIEGKYAWELLRASRWNPPGAANSAPERRATYQTGLEQSEGLFKAAAGVGPVSRPILVFYGLSQAGRAIAAAASAAGDDGWKLNGHGIKALEMSKPLPDVLLKTDLPGGTGSFVRLSGLLNSSVWGKSTAIPFATLWDMLPENTSDSQALRDDLKARRTPLDVDTMGIEHEPHSLATVTVGGIPPWVCDAPDLRTVFEEYLKSFAGAREHSSYYKTHATYLPDISRQPDGWGFLNMNFKMPGGTLEVGETRAAYVRSLAQRYKDSYYFFPETPAGRLHPLMMWWAVLYTLSMIARYEPAAWTTQLDINNSRFAQPVESILDTALEQVPPLIVEAIKDVG
jgi:hypothetical protein